MPNQNPEQPVDFSDYFEKNKKASSASSLQPGNAVKGLQGLVIKLSHGMIRSPRQANAVLVIIFVLCVAGTAYVLFAPRVELQTQVTKPSPLIHPTIK